MKVHRTIYTCYVWAVMRLQQSNSAVDLLTLSEFLINKHLTGVQAQATGHRWCESTNAQCVLLGSKHKWQATAGVKVWTLSAFYQEQIIVCR